MSKFDMQSVVKAIRFIDPFDQANTTDLVSEEIDTDGFESLVLLFALGALNDLVSTVLVEHSTVSGSGFTAVPDSQLNGLETSLTIAGDDDNKVAQIGYHGDRQFVRATLVVTTGSGVNLVAGIALLGTPHRAATTASVFA